MEDKENPTENPELRLADDPDSDGVSEAAEGSADEIVKLTAVADEWKNRAAYMAAEVDNMRKRFARERIEVVRMANESLIRTLLPVLDNLQLGLKAAQDGDKAQRENPVFVNLIKGIDMVFKQFEQSLEQVGVKPIKALGQNFDPTQHEAIGQSSEAEIPDDQITTELQRGFTLHDRVIRPAKVVVNKVQN